MLAACVCEGSTTAAQYTCNAWGTRGWMWKLEHLNPLAWIQRIWQPIACKPLRGIHDSCAAHLHGERPARMRWRLLNSLPSFLQAQRRTDCMPLSHEC